MITKEMKEAIEYLSNKDNYIDIYTKSKEDMDKISEDLKRLGWKQGKTRTDSKYFWYACFEKNTTTVDLIYTVSEAEVCFPLRQKFKRDGIELYTISTETLFLEKLNQVSDLHRTPEKTRRDRKAIVILRKMIDINKIQKLVPKLKDLFWREGYL
jgi:hypothetical protein